MSESDMDDGDFNWASLAPQQSLEKEAAESDGDPEVCRI